MTIQGQKGVPVQAGTRLPEALPNSKWTWACTSHAGLRFPAQAKNQVQQGPNIIYTAMNTWRNSHCYCLHQNPSIWNIYNAHILYIHLHLEIGFKNIWQQSCMHHQRLIPQEKETQLYVLGTGVKWFININKILNIKLPAKGCELPIYHPRHIGEKNLLTNYTKKRHLTDDWKQKLELLNTKQRQLTATGKTWTWTLFKTK